MWYQTKENMRSFILMTVALAVLAGSLLSQTSYAQSEGGIARLSSAAYQPDSPVNENRLFRWQTGHDGFAYNCDGEENKRNHPAISWRVSDADQLPKRMGCWERVKHEAAQVSRRILDGMCDSGCSSCQQRRKPNCACGKCVVQQGVAESTTVAELVVDQGQERASVTVEPMVAEIAPTTNLSTATSFAPAMNTGTATGRRSGLIRLTRLDSVAETVQSSEEPLTSTQQADSATIEYVKPPVARITSAVAAPTVTGAVAGTTDSSRLGLLERLKIIQALHASDTTKAKKF